VQSTDSPDAPSVCPLIVGGRSCTCASESAALGDKGVAERAAGMLVWYQRAPHEGRAEVRRGLDELLSCSRSRGRSALAAELLRISIMVRLIPDDTADGHDDAAKVESMLAEFSRIAEHDGDAVRFAEAAVFRALRAMRFGFGENALGDAAVALATLSDATAPPDTGEDLEDWHRREVRTLNGLVMVLLKLGAHELADEVSRRAVVVADEHGSIMERLVNQLNRVRLQVSWALRLERGGRDAAAATRFVGAAQTAHVAAGLWTIAHNREPGQGPLAIEECSIIGAAYALQRPSVGHLDMLIELHQHAHIPDDGIVLAVATSRCLMAAGRIDDALDELTRLRGEVRDNPESGLQLALHRELAIVDAAVRRAAGGPEGAVDGQGRGDTGPATGSEAVLRYATALEGELWALREARLTALRSHSEHHRLAREHGAVAAQALQDPLTGLPNRRALDLRLAEATSSPAAQPCTVALVDLDRFKAVNDAKSHAVGDSVLREIASSLRTTLRSHDMVARYGGDEFVVVLPATPLGVAVAALTRATEAVAALPPEAASGVTMSIGVAAAPLGSEPTAALAAADAAMYRAKRAGGNTVVSGLLGEVHRRPAPPRPPTPFPTVPRPSRTPPTERLPAQAPVPPTAPLPATHPYVPRRPGGTAVRTD
jgi:diguanylate cyclase (GGDEF)-like protein